jgi:hypothetical protein
MDLNSLYHRRGVSTDSAASRAEIAAVRPELSK